MNDRAILNKRQIEVLLKPISRQRVGNKQGQSHVEAYDIRAHLIRMFGFGNWDFDILESELLFDNDRKLKNGKEGCYIAYRVTVRITVRNEVGDTVAHYDGTAVGSATQPDYMRADAHDMAVKTAESQALKRAAINLGDQFGLSLYNGGSTNALVRKVVVEGDQIEHDDLPVIQAEVHDVVMPRTDDDDLALERMADPEPQQATLEDMGELMISDRQIKQMQTLFGKAGIKERDAKLEWINERVPEKVSSSKDLTEVQADDLIRLLKELTG